MGVIVVIVVYGRHATDDRAVTLGQEQLHPGVLVERVFSGSNFRRSSKINGGTQCGSLRYLVNGYFTNRFRSARDSTE